MATSTIGIKGKVYVIDGTLSSERTGDYITEDMLPANAVVISGQWLTSYNQWRTFNIGLTDSGLIIITGQTESMKGRPYKVIYTIL